jgi:hypothetical protein
MKTMKAFLLWVAVAAVAMANRGQLSRQPQLKN